jgi:hypothetical protein
MRWNRLSVIWVFVLVVCWAAALGAEGPSQRGIVIPAISFTGQGGGEVNRAEPQENPGPGFIHLWYTPGHWLEWVVEGAAAGDYRVAVRHAGRFSVERSLTLNGRAVAGLESFTLEATGTREQNRGWNQWSETTLPAAVTLAAGRNVLRMTCLDNSSVRISDITLTAPGKEPVTIEASAFTGQSGGRVGVHVPPGMGRVGSAWRSSWKDEGHWLEWTFESPAAGRYGVGLHYRADGYCRLELQVNSEKAKGLEDFIPPKTCGLDIYNVGTLPEPVTLRRGENTLRLTILGGPRRVVPQFSGMLALSAIHLSPLPGGAPPGGNVLTLSTIDEIRRAARKAAEQDVPPAPLGPPLPAVEGAIPLTEGHRFTQGGYTVTVAQADTLPYVDNEFTKTCVWDNYDNPMLKELRETYKLGEVVAAGKDEYEKQVLLMKWVWEQWDHGHAQELYYLKDPAWIVSEARKEHIFQCMHSGNVMMSVMASMGWICRIAGHSSHTWNEVWSNQHRKWMHFDATSNAHHERDGVPLSTYEYYHARYVELAEDVITFSRSDRRFTAPPRPGRVANVSIRGTNTYMTSRSRTPSARLRIGKDVTPALDPKELYYPLNQAALALVPEGNAVKVTIGTMTPNFKEFRVRIDGGLWRKTEPAFTWELHNGTNRLEAKSVNRFGVDGPVSTVVLDVTP